MAKKIRRNRTNTKYMVLWGAIFGAIGLFIIVAFAATSNVSYNFEAENGTVAGNAAKAPNSSASGATVVKFGSPSCPSGECIPSGNVTSGGHTWTQVVKEDFTKDAPLGSWGSPCTKKVVYTGQTGTGWDSYPSCYKDTYQDRPYRADQVLSVHNGMLDFWLHNVDGIPAGANISPVLPSGSKYQTYGRYEARFKLTTNQLSEFYQAWLLWPDTDAMGRCAESDFPESILSSPTIGAFSHYCTTPDDGVRHQKAISGISVDRTEWHTYTQEWLPGIRNYYVDGTLVGTSTTAIWDKPMRWQLQNETKTTCDQTTPHTCTEDGHMLVDWAVVYAY